MSVNDYENFITNSYLVYPLNNTKSEVTLLSDLKSAFSICDMDIDNKTINIDKFYNPVNNLY
jgi:hypothetical protein